MKYLLAAIIVSLSLQGCVWNNTTPIKTDVVYVDKLVPVEAAQPPITPRPVLPIEQLTETQKADEGEVAKAYKATVKALEGYATQLEIIIEGYRKKP